MFVSCVCLPLENQGKVVLAVNIAAKGVNTRCKLQTRLEPFSLKSRCIVGW